MNRPLRIGAALVVGSVFVAQLSVAQQPSALPSAAKASAAASAPASASASASAAAPKPSGSASAPGSQASVTASGSVVAPPAALPPGHPAPGAPSPGMEDDEPRIPRDIVMDDPSIPPGSIYTSIVDETGKAVTDVEVILTITRTKVSEGESSSKTSKTSDAKGLAVWKDLPRGTDVTYAVSVANSAPEAPAFTAVYSSSAFNLPLDRGFRIQLHRFPVASSIDKLMVAVEGADTIIEIRDDQLEVQQIFDIINVGTTTWSLGPNGLELGLPPGSKGLRTGETVETHGAVGVEGKGVKWIGAFRPGRSRLGYDYKIPFDGSGEIDLEIPLPPRVMVARLRVPTRKGMTVAVEGFPATRPEMTEIGVKVASTLKQGTPDQPIVRLKIHIAGIPTAGPARNAAFVGALALLLVGLWLGTRAHARKELEASGSLRERIRLRLLDEVRELDRALADGRIGPKAHARERARLVDDIGSTLEV